MVRSAAAQLEQTRQRLRQVASGAAPCRGSARHACSPVVGAWAAARLPTATPLITSSFPVSWLTRVQVSGMARAKMRRSTAGGRVAAAAVQGFLFGQRHRS